MSRDGHLRRLIMAAASPARTLAEVAAIVGCHVTYASAVLRRLNLPYRRIGNGNDEAQTPRLRADAVPIGDTQDAIEARRANLKAGERFLAALWAAHPNGRPRMSNQDRVEIATLLQEVDRVIGETPPFLCVGGDRTVPISSYALVRLRDARHAVARERGERVPHHAPRAIPEGRRPGPETAK